MAFVRAYPNDHTCESLSKDIAGGGGSDKSDRECSAFTVRLEQASDPARVRSGLRRFWGHILFTAVASRLPRSGFPYLGAVARDLRYRACKLIFQECGHDVNIEAGVKIGRRVSISIGDHSGLGVNLVVGRPLVVGRDVMIGRDVRLIIRNHVFARTDIPMRRQGFTAPTCLRICDDVWIGDQVVILPRVKRIGKGAILGTRALITRDVPDYAVMGGNPARVLKSRTLTHDPTGERKLTLPSGMYE